MRKLQKPAAFLLTVVLLISMLTGCAGEETEGLSVSVCVGTSPVTLDPIYAENSADQTVLVHLYENLMRVASDGEGGTTVVNGVAKSVEHEENHDGTVTFTFRLRDAEWSDGREVKASDFVYAWQRLANPASQSPYAELLSVVVGYEEARASGDMSLLQVTAKNDSTLVVNLTGHYDWFLSEVCTSPATMPLRQDVVLRLKESNITGVWWRKPSELVTNGAYQIAEYELSHLTLTGAKHYDGKHAGPQEITFRFADGEEEAWVLYEDQQVDAVWTVSAERLSELSADENWTAEPEMATHTVLFNHNHPLLGDPLIRQALCMVIDRNMLAELVGTTARAAEGLVPFGVPEDGERDFRASGGALLDNDPETYAARCEDAKALLEGAGYTSGSELGELEFLYVAGGMADAVAEDLCRQWSDALGIRVTPNGVSETALWMSLRSGEYSLAGVELTAVGNDAECFLMEWTSQNPNNVLGYENTAYDTLMSIIAGAADGSARLGCLHDAEVLLLSDYALAPLYTHGVAWEMRPELAGVCRDARGWFNFSDVTEKTA